MLLTPRTYFDVRGDRWFEIASRWELRPVEESPERERLLAAQEFYEGVREALWGRPEASAESR
jgi:hypothetical protein